MSEPRPTKITLNMMQDALYAAVVADALDSMGYTNQSPRLSFPTRTVDRLLVGRCKTTQWEDVYEDLANPYELELSAVDSCAVGDVLIAAAEGSMRSAIWGELLSTAAGNAGCQGAIIDGAARDVDKIRAMGFGCYARGTSVYDSQNRQRVVAYDVPVKIDGVEFSPGDLVLADEDGVVVVPAGIEQEAIGRAWDKVHTENEIRDSIRQGMKATDAYAKYGVL